MSDIYPPFLKWGEYKSHDEKTPDVLHVEPLEIETFETEFGINVRAKVNGTEMNIPLQNFGSMNRQLFEKWNNAIKENKIKVGKKFQLKTWKEQSTRNKDREIRRFELVF